MTVEVSNNWVLFYFIAIFRPLENVKIIFAKTIIKFVNIENNPYQEGIPHS